MAAAELLLSEEFFGIAVSRAYYAMFHVAQAFLHERGIGSSRHSGVIGVFGRDLARHGIVPLRFHGYLIDGQTARLLADYRGTPTTAEEAQLHIDHAREMLAFARQHFAGRSSSSA